MASRERKALRVRLARQHAGLPVSIILACSLNSEGSECNHGQVGFDPLKHSRNWALAELRLTGITLVEGNGSAKLSSCPSGSVT